MQFARATEVVEPVSDVRVLLNLQQGDPAADGMDRTRRHEEEVPTAGSPPVHIFLDRPAERRLAQLLRRKAMLQPEPDYCIRFRVCDVPALGLSAREATRARLLVVRMDLDR